MGLSPFTVEVGNSCAKKDVKNSTGSDESGFCDLADLAKLHVSETARPR
jgi:hypothetical protein